ncbi:glycosyl hydrolase [Paenibacillus sp. J5C_2022]|nr:glycosyl hydrolase [Paenibacillus sp. J5C2022]
MHNRLSDVITGKEANYIIPLFWLHGEEEAVIREEMARIDESGIKALCVESRPHPDFMGPSWWRDMDVIMDEARRRGLKIWVFDDDHFPTGHAAGALKHAPRELRRLFIKEHHIDVVGPLQHASIPVKAPIVGWQTADERGNRLIGAAAYKRRSGSGELIAGSGIDLSGFIRADTVYWNIPEGLWRIFFFSETPTGGSEHEKDYLNPIVPESVRVLIDTVYEPFYERYKQDFGHAFAGFFSDEPGFNNDKEASFEAKIGKKNMVLPWNAELETILKERWGTEFVLFLPLLWQECGAAAWPVRYAFMDEATKLYARHFTDQIGDWCRSRGVEYIGHVIEDNNVHARLGPGPGHFFRAMWGQDMSGIDVVLRQIVPGFDETPLTWIAGETDSEFFHYGLAKLGSSLGHLDPQKQGRTLAEVFGAYGWSEGLKLMKWLTDHMLVRGVNYFMPHSFSLKEYPDPDCPPHLYAGGKNPQYRYYRELNRYTNRMCHLLSGGRHIAPVAVLYHAEAEWSGNCMLFHRPVKELLRGQIDCDVVSPDMVVRMASVHEGKLHVNMETFDCLVLPYSEALPIRLLEAVIEYAAQGLPVLFIDGLPHRSSDGDDASALLARLAGQDHIDTVPLTELTVRLRAMGIHDIEVEEYAPYLRYYHYEHDNMNVYMFFNEHPYERMHVNVRIALEERMYLYDAFANHLEPSEAVSSAQGITFPLELHPYESAILLAGDIGQDISPDSRSNLTAAQPDSFMPITGPWDVSIAGSEAYPHFEPWDQLHVLEDLSRPERLPSFSGTFRYEGQFEWKQEGIPLCLDLGHAYETVQVWINGTDAGIKISPPYRFFIGDMDLRELNKITIDVTNTLAREQPDPFSRFAPLEPSGLIGPVRVLFRSSRRMHNYAKRLYFPPEST